jgi:hypothetical protein
MSSEEHESSYIFFAFFFREVDIQPCAFRHQLLAFNHVFLAAFLHLVMTIEMTCFHFSRSHILTSYTSPFHNEPGNI